MVHKEQDQVMFFLIFDKIEKSRCFDLLKVFELFDNDESGIMSLPKVLTMNQFRYINKPYINKPYIKNVNASNITHLSMGDIYIS